MLRCACPTILGLTRSHRRSPSLGSQADAGLGVVSHADSLLRRTTADSPFSITPHSATQSPGPLLLDDVGQLPLPLPLPHSVTVDARNAAPDVQAGVVGTNSRSRVAPATLGTNTTSPKPHFGLESPTSEDGATCSMTGGGGAGGVVAGGSSATPGHDLGLGAVATGLREPSPDDGERAGGRHTGHGEGGMGRHSTQSRADRHGGGGADVGSMAVHRDAGHASGQKHPPRTPRVSKHGTLTLLRVLVSRCVRCCWRRDESLVLSTRCACDMLVACCSRPIVCVVCGDGCGGQVVGVDHQGWRW